MPRRHTQTRLGMLCVLLGLSISAGPARAHDPSLSGIRVLYQRHDVVVSVMTHLSRLRRAEGRGDALMTPTELDQAIQRRLHVSFDGRSFVPSQTNVLTDTTGDVLSWQAVTPAPVRQCEVLARLYPEDTQSRTVVSILRVGQTVQETLLDAEHPDFLATQPAPGAWAVALRFLREGVVHILSGPDHILFVLVFLHGRTEVSKNWYFARREQ